MSAHHRITAAAWVPQRENMSWDEASELAVDWTQVRCAEEGLGLLLVQTHNNVPRGTGPLGRFAGRNHVTTVNSQGNYSWRGGPVLAYCPSPKAMTLAMDLALDASLCIVEGALSDWTGWAIEMQALDLITGEITPDSRTDEQRAVFDQLDLYVNNAFGDSLAKTQVPRKLEQLMSSGLTPEIIFGISVARGADERGVKNLTKYVDAVNGRRQ